MLGLRLHALMDGSNQRLLALFNTSPRPLSLSPSFALLLISLSLLLVNIQQELVLPRVQSCVAEHLQHSACSSIVF